MRRYNVHLWLLINIGFAMGLYFEQPFVKDLIAPLFLLSMLLLKTKDQIKKEYTQKVGWPMILVATVVVGGLLILVITGFTRYLNDSPMLQTELFLAITLITYVMYLLNNVSKKT